LVLSSKFFLEFGSKKYDGNGNPRNVEKAWTKADFDLFVV